MAQFIPGIYNNFYYKILGYFWDVIVFVWFVKSQCFKSKPEPQQVIKLIEICLMNVDCGVFKYSKITC